MMSSRAVISEVREGGAVMSLECIVKGDWDKFGMHYEGSATEGRGGRSGRRDGRIQAKNKNPTQ